MTLKYFKSNGYFPLNYFKLVIFHEIVQHIIAKYCRQKRIWVILTVVIFFTFTYTADNVVFVWVNVCVFVCVCVKHSSIQQKRSHSPVLSCVSMKSDQSMDPPLQFAEGGVPAGQRWVVMRTFHRKYNHPYSHLKYTWSVKVYQMCLTCFFVLDIYMRWEVIDIS